MKFETSKEITAYLSAKNKVILKACPGSGKTTTVAYKLNQIISTRSKGSVSGIACLSFTNVAKNEIKEKFNTFSGRLLSYPDTVSTIDSFINKYITLPYFYKINSDITRPLILDNNSKLNNISGTWLKYRTKRSQPLALIYPPSTISIDLQQKFLQKNKRNNKAIVSDSIFDSYCKDIKSWQTAKGILTNEDSTYFALKILKKHPRIAKHLCKRFSHIIIDEAQDTSEIQYEILNELIKNGLENVELIGDPYQSLYEFRNARPDLFNNQFISDDWDSHELMNCRRSSQNTIDCYAQIREKGEKPITSIATTKYNKPVHVIFYKVGEEFNLVEIYEKACSEFENNIVLVRGKKHLEALGVKISDENPWKTNFAMNLIRCKRLLNEGNIKEAIKWTRRTIIELSNPSKNFHEIRELINDAKKDYKQNILLLSILRNMPDFSLSIEDWNTNFIKLIQNLTGMSKIDFQLKKGGKWAKEIKNNVESFFSINTPFETKVKTIHQVKGMTFDSTLTILSKDNRGQNISIKQLEQSTSFPDEKKRMTYVALSRARELTCIGIPDNLTLKEVKKIIPNCIELK